MVEMQAHAWAPRRALTRLTGELVLPTREEFLKNACRMKSDCLVFMEEAERRGDSREAHEFKEHLERVESMIEQSGGDPDV
jgi:hypothetical protein